MLVSRLAKIIMAPICGLLLSFLLLAWGSQAFGQQALSASLAASPASPQSAGTSITWTATASGGTSPYQYRFWLYDGTSWSIAQDYASSNTWIWPPLMGASIT